MPRGLKPLTRTCVRLNWTVGDSGQREIVNPCAVTAINPVQLGSHIMQAIKLMITRAKTIKSFTVSRRSARRRALSVLSSVMARNVPSPIKETQQLSECSVPDTCPTRSRAIFCAPGAQYLPVPLPTPAQAFAEARKIVDNKVGGPK